ncbi:MAG: SurA N-terminal domain-containing protein [Rhabdaerophilum sp.]
MKKFAFILMLALQAAVMVSPAPAQAQSVLAMVNQQPVTSFDVAQRIRIAQLTDGRRLSQQAALQELIDDRVKLIQARKVGYRVTEEGVDAEYARVARGGGRTNAQFEAALRQSGVEPTALRDKMRADLAWQIILREQARKGSDLSSAELENAVQQEMKKQRTITDYQLQSVIFVVPRGTNPGERERAANAARGRFTSCETGFDELRTMRDVAVRPSLFRSTEGMSEQLMKVLERTPVGRLTPASRTEQGIEMVAVCERKVREPSANLRSEVTSAVMERRITEVARKYILELRKTTDIRMMR